MGYEAFVLLWIICAVACAAMAHAKNRNFGGWLLIGIATGIVGLLALMTLPPLETSRTS